MRSLAWVLVGVLSAGAAAQGAIPAWATPEAEKIAESCRAAIRAEIAAGAAPDWAGEYYEGDGEGENVTLVLAPKAGFVVENHGCLGLYGRNYGSVQVVDDRLKLGFTFGSERKDWDLAPELVPVRWGDRHYLLPADDIIGFCNEINGGREPRDVVHGFYLLRRGDESVKVTGKPALPGDAMEALLPAPVEAIALAVGETTTEEGRSNTVFEYTHVTISAGSLHGLRVGMRFYIVEPKFGAFWATVEKVDERTSEVVVLAMPQSGDPRPAAGWRFSTRLPGHPLPMEAVVPAR